MRTYLSTNFAMVVVPEQLALSAADKQLGDAQALKDERMDQMLGKLVASVVRQARWTLQGR